jgi:hypothetical protein
MCPERTVTYVSGPDLDRGRPSARYHERCGAPLFDAQRPAGSLRFAQAISAVPNYPEEYTYEHFSHVWLARLGYIGSGTRRLLDSVVPGWEEAIDWSLLLEREPFFDRIMSVAVILCFLQLRAVLAWYANRRLSMPRFHLREHALRAGAAFFSAPGIKQ